MILLLDFGNTRVKAAVYDGGAVQSIYSGPVDTASLCDAVEGKGISGGMWCSVHPLPDDIIRWMSGLGLSALTYKTPVPIVNSYSNPQTLGMDRLAAAVGAWSMNPGHDMLVIDAGTALTIDFISADGVYHGGNIAPGIELRFKALHEHTGALPLVSAQGDAPMFGYDTESAIRSGVLRGIRNEVNGYIEEMGGVYPSLLVFLTGGDAEFFDIKGKSTTFAVTELVLEGLARIVDYNEKGF
ncbi:MAG: type III pantothenate kinase [Bacteroidaceae bacterium]|jgi:type III pantothenate kinase|nr:type III pantothenate kinase [Bacteroidaceae bacterium]